MEKESQSGSCICSRRYGDRQPRFAAVCRCLLAQGYMPAQQIHILVNPTSRDLSPWYELTETDAGKLYTPEWIF